jgi:hypothetical protein
LVVVLGLAAYFYFRESGQEQEGAKRMISDDEIARTGGSLPKDTGGGGTGTGITPGVTPLPGQSPTASVTATTTASATTTPYPNSGVFDWTRYPKVAKLDFKPSFTAEEIEQIQSGDICGIADISDSWSDPFEKIVCNMTEFTFYKIIMPLQELSCDFLVAALQLNYGSNITADNTGGACKIIDR